MIKDDPARAKGWYALNPKYSQCQHSKCHRRGPLDYCILIRSVLEHNTVCSEHQIPLYEFLRWWFHGKQYQSIFFHTIDRQSSHAIYVSSRDNHICYEGESGIYIQNSTNYISLALSKTMNFSACDNFSSHFIHTSFPERYNLQFLELMKILHFI